MQQYQVSLLNIWRQKLFQLTEMTSAQSDATFPLTTSAFNTSVTGTTFPITSTWPHLNSDVGLEEGEC